MATTTTVCVERCRGTERRRRRRGDVIEPWFVLSRAAYQRILDDALADMTSAEALQRAPRPASAAGASELLRLLSDDVSGEQPRSDDDVTADEDRLTVTGARLTEIVQLNYQLNVN